MVYSCPRKYFAKIPGIVAPSYCPTPILRYNKVSSRGQDKQKQGNQTMTTTKQIRKEIKDSFVESTKTIYTLTPLCNAIDHIKNLAANQVGREKVFTIESRLSSRGVLVTATGQRSILFTKP